MKKTGLLLTLIGATLLVGCDKETKINSEKINLLSQNIIQLEQSQAKQMAVLQSELNSLAPRLDKINDFYFEKSHDDAFFYHTNTLFLLLTVGQRIEAQLQMADTKSDAEKSLAYYYHTNQTGTMYLCSMQIQDAMSTQEKRIEDNVNAQTVRMGAALSDELLNQMKLLTPDAAEITRQKDMEAEVAQIKADLDQIKAQLEITNHPLPR